MNTCGDCPEMMACEDVRLIISNNADARKRLETEQK